MCMIAHVQRACDHGKLQWYERHGNTGPNPAKKMEDPVRRRRFPLKHQCNHWTAGSSYELSTCGLRGWQTFRISISQSSDFSTKVRIRDDTCAEHWSVLAH